MELFVNCGKSLNCLNTLKNIQRIQAYGTSEQNFATHKYSWVTQKSSINKRKKRCYRTSPTALINAVETGKFPCWRSKCFFVIDQREDIRACFNTFSSCIWINKNFFAQISKTIKVSVDELNVDISSGDVEVSFVQSLIKEGVQVNRQDDDGKTALQIASQHGNVTALNDTNVQIF